MMRYSYIFLVLVFFISCSKPEPRKPIKRKTGTFIQESIDRNKLLNKQEESLLKLRMERDTLNVYHLSPNGFWYCYNQKDSLSGRSPIKGDEVNFTYEIRNLNDSILFSKEELGMRNYLVDKEELITGLQDGIKIMKEGETITFLFPSHKAYGYSGNERVQSSQPLVYEVYLKEIINKN